MQSTLACIWLRAEFSTTQTDNTFCTIDDNNRTVAVFSTSTTLTLLSTLQNETATKPAEISLIQKDSANAPVQHQRHVCVQNVGDDFKKKRVYLKDDFALKHNHIKLFECEKCESLSSYSNNFKQHK